MLLSVKTNLSYARHAFNSHADKQQQITIQLSSHYRRSSVLPHRYVVHNDVESCQIDIHKTEHTDLWARMVTLGTSDHVAVAPCGRRGPTRASTDKSAPDTGRKPRAFARPRTRGPLPSPVRSVGASAARAIPPALTLLTSCRAGPVRHRTARPQSRRQQRRLRQLLPRRARLPRLLRVDLDAHGHCVVSATATAITCTSAGSRLARHHRGVERRKLA